MNRALIRKYNVPGPRYTSYPPVTSWQNAPDELIWKKHVHNTFRESNQEQGISLYLHLPFCESLCTYCGCNTRITVNHKVEQPYINAVLDEWNLYLDLFDQKPRIAEIHLGGGTPTFFSAKNLVSLINGITQNAEVLENAELSFEAHPKNTSIEHLQTLYDLGFRRLSLGIQDFDPNVQKIVNRIQPYSMVKAVVDNARRIGYSSINFDLIYGLPLQQKQSVIDTIEKVAQLMPERIAFYSYAHVPWKRPGQRMFTEDDLPSGAEKRELYELGKERFEELGYMEIGMDHFALPGDPLFEAYQEGHLHRNFMGYTTRHTKLTVGLGASSIGDTWTAYGQNIKSVEQYKDCISQGKFPIFKGHVLAESELRIRQNIKELMCNFQTEWSNELYSEHEIPDKSLEQLNELVADDLIIFEQEKIYVLEKGKPFVRNICMAIDPVFQVEKEKNVFSKTI